MKIFISVALLAFAGLFQEGDAAITAWTEPTINAAASGTVSYSFAEDVATGTAGVGKTIAATGTGAITYTLLTSGTPFSIANSNELSLDTALDYETTTTYTIEIQAVDSATPAGSGTATITVTVTDVNEAPTFTATSFGYCIADGSAAGTTLATVAATDQDSGDVITYSITAGSNTNTDFSIASTGVITVASGKTLVASTTPSYALEIEAADDDTPSLTGQTTVFVLVQSSCSSGSGSAALLASTFMIMMMSFITLLR